MLSKITKVDYVAFELFASYHLNKNKWTTMDRIKRLWDVARHDMWRSRAQDAIAAVTRWEEWHAANSKVEPPPERPHIITQSERREE